MNRKALFFGLSLSAIAAVAVIACNGISNSNLMPRPEGPCDIYDAAGTPCVTAHSSTRALYASYNGPLYQVMRQSDGKTLDINVVKASANDPGGYADAAAQDEFCKDSYCWITVLYDQSPKGNHLYQSPRGGFSGAAMGGYNNVPIAHWAPVNVMGHKVYGIFISPGMGLRLNDPVGTAVDDQAEGQYWVINGHHYNTGCCFDYGNAETDSRDDGDGTMESTYFGNQGGWYYGEGDGPWIMSDQENNLVGCVNEDPNDKFCKGLESITWRFVTATADGEPHHWRTMGGNAQEGSLKVYYDGGRIQNETSSYDPMRKQGAIVLGNGGDNSNGSAGTFYEGAMTAAGTFPTEETNQAIQANVVAARYNVATVEIFPSLEGNRPSNVQTFALGSKGSSVVRFVNTTSETINDLVLSVKAPKGWKASVTGSSDKQMKVAYAVEPGQTVVAEFDITSSNSSFNGDLVAIASWDGKTETGLLKVRNAAPVKINEFSISDSFIELYNAGDKEVDLSDWTLTQHPSRIPYFSNIRIPSGTKLAPKSFYLLGMANSGLAVDAAKGDNVVYLRSVEGISAGDEITIGGEKNTVKAVIAPEPLPNTESSAILPTTVWQPLPGGHGIEIPVGSTNIPLTSVEGFTVGQKMAIGYGTDKPAVSNSLEKYEVVTVTAVGKAGTQTYLSMDAKPGDTNIKVYSTQNISVGDKIRLDIASEGHGIETVTVTKVGTPANRNTYYGPLRDSDDPGTGLDLAEPLKYAHASNMPLSVNGTGVSFEPASKFPHYSNEPVLALGYAIELESALKSNHKIDEAITASASKAGYNGTIPADLLFGGPALSSNGGNITLRDSKGNVADALNYGDVVDPWLSEGYQADTTPGEYGNYVDTPAPEFMDHFMKNPEMTVSLSSGRYPDGADKDDNKYDFHRQNSTSILCGSVVGERNVKIASTMGLKPGDTVIIGVGAKMQAVKVEKVGTCGYTLSSLPCPAGSKTVYVTATDNFSAGDEILIGDEKGVIAEVHPNPKWWLPSAPKDNWLVLRTALRKSHPGSETVTGTGLTLAESLNSAYPSGTPIASGKTTPGSANQY